MRRTELGLGVALVSAACIVSTGELRCATAIDVEGGLGGAGEGGSGPGATTGATASSTGSASSSSGSSGSGSGGSGSCVPGSTEPCYSGPVGTAGVGLCQEGIRTCNAAGTGFGLCAGEVTPTAETCATPGDEDCDGQTNEEGAGCTCMFGTTMPCYSGPAGTEGVGLCQGGTQSCLPSGTGYGPCTGEVLPVPENCSTLADDNCNGEINETSAGCMPEMCTGCTVSPVGDCPSDVVVVGHYAGGNKTVCIGQGDGTPFKLVLMSYDATKWALTGAIGRVSTIQIYTFDPGTTSSGSGAIPTSIQMRGKVPGDPYGYTTPGMGTLSNCLAHTWYAGEVFGVPPASVCHMEEGLPDKCGYPSYDCLSISP